MSAGLGVYAVAPIGAGEIRYEVRSDGEVLCWVRVEGDALHYTTRAPWAEVDYWHLLCPEEWEQEMGGLASYAELRAAVDAAPV